MRGSPLRVFFCLTLLGGFPTLSAAQSESTVYIGGLVGVSTLSADARSVVSGDEVAVALYEPQNGMAANLLIGIHVHDYVTVQANYISNRNDLMLLSTLSAPTGGSVTQAFSESAQHMVVGDLLVYFRPRGDRIRPYLSGGFGITRLRTETLDQRPTGAASQTPTVETDALATLRVAVGLDVAVGGGWSVRYSFSENVSRNPISERLTPAGRRNLANFQNLVGAFWSF